MVEMPTALKETYDLLHGNKGQISSKAFLVENLEVGVKALQFRIDRLRTSINKDEMIYTIHDEGYLLNERLENNSWIQVYPVKSNYNLEFFSQRDSEIIYGCRVNRTRLVRRLQINEIALLSLLWELNSCDPGSFVPTKEIANEYYHLKEESVVSIFHDVKRKLGKSVSFRIESKIWYGYRLVVADGIEPSTFPM